MSMIPASQNKRRALVRAGMAGLALAYVALMAAARMWDAPVHGASIAVLIAFCIFAILEFSVFDEVAKQAHYVAWYWGAFLGLFALAGLHILLSFDHQAIVSLQRSLVSFLGDGGPYAAFVAGTVVTPLLMMAGFVIVRFADWLRSR